MPGPDFPAEWNLSALLAATPFETRDDVLAVMPSWMRDDEQSIPVRDAIGDGLLRAFAAYCSDTAAFAAKVDPLYAEGSDLDFAGAQRGIARALDEDDVSYRARVLGDSDLLTPTAVMAAISAIVAPFAPGRTPYYFERPDDEIYVWDSSAPVGNDGVYLNSDASLVYSNRAYVVRPNSTPRYGLVWDQFRTPNATAGGADYSDCFNAWGDTIIALPALPLPGSQLDGDAFVRTPPAVLIDVSGNLTPDAVTAAAAMGEVAAIGDASDFGANLFSSGSDVATVVSRVQALLETRAGFGGQFTLMIDPAL